MTDKFSFPGMTPGPWVVGTDKDGDICIRGAGAYCAKINVNMNPGDAKAIAALPDILSRLAKLEKVLEAAKRELSEKSETNPCHRTPCPCEEAIYTFCELRAAIAACEEGKP